MNRGSQSAPCVMPGCEAPSRTWGYCVKHYQRAKRHGDPNAVQRIPPISLPLAERAWRYITRDLDTGCWNWTGVKANGYGRVRVVDRDMPAHRALYELLVE